MPSTVESLMQTADLEYGGAVAWREAVPEVKPGIYIVSLFRKPASKGSKVHEAPVDPRAIDFLLQERPELRVDGQRPSPQALHERLGEFWLRDESVLYVGLAGTSIQRRVDQYYKTKLGARSPHAGGWFLKTLNLLPETWVHYAAAEDPAEAERRLLEAFANGVSEDSKQCLRDRERIMPFANLEYPKGVRKGHGIAGARAAKGRKSPGEVPRDRSPGGTNSKHGSASEAGHPKTLESHLRTQRVTESDIRRGQIRIPIGASKSAFPRTKGPIEVELRGKPLSCRWDPRFGGTRERSGVIGVGRRNLEGTVEPNEVLRVTESDGVIHLS